MKAFLLLPRAVFSSTCMLSPPASWGSCLSSLFLQFHSSIFNFFSSSIGPISRKSYPHLSPHFLTSHWMHNAISDQWRSSALFLMKSSVPPLVISTRSSFCLHLTSPLNSIWSSQPFSLSWNSFLSCPQAWHSLLEFLFITQASLYKFFCQHLLLQLINIWLLQDWVLGSFLFSL